MEEIEFAMNTVYAKILKARKIIKESPIKKDGRNKYSEYDYFTPDQVSSLVNTACQEVGILHVFSLLNDNNGLFGSLSIIDVDNGNSITTNMRTAIPSITATNDTQKMGGCETYTKRYMLMSMFDIADNNLDFDSKDNSGGDTTRKQKSEAKPGLRKKNIPSSLAQKTDDNVTPVDNTDNYSDRFKEMISEVYSLSTAEEIKETSPAIIRRASELGLTDSEVSSLKSEINARYKQLKS